jgi:hypothetical protein
MVPSVNGDGFTTDRGAHKLTVLHRYRKCDQARPPHFIALLDDDIVLAVAGRRKAKEGAGEGGSGAPVAGSSLKSIGHQHVLEPELGSKNGAHDFAQHLLTRRPSFLPPAAEIADPRNMHA